MTCLYCSKPLSAYQKKYCSFECQNKSFSIIFKKRQLEEYENNPKFCKHCETKLSYEKRKLQFCNHSCAATHNNTGRTSSDKINEKISLSLLFHHHKNKNIDWVKVQDYYNEMGSMKKCAKKFKIGSKTIYDAKMRGDFKPKERNYFNIEKALQEKSTNKRQDIKKHLIKENILPNKCANCDHEPFWDGKPLVLVLDHKNGINNDNRIENLRLLCPNCNSQTETFCKGHKKKNKPVRTKELIEAIRNTETIKDALLSLGMEPSGNNYARITRLAG